MTIFARRFNYKVLDCFVMYKMLYTGYFHINVFFFFSMCVFMHVTLMSI